MKSIAISSAILAAVSGASALAIPVSATLPAGSMTSVAAFPSATVTVIAESTTVAGARATAALAKPAAAQVAGSFTCPTGSALTYAIATQQLPAGVSLTTAQNYFNNWAHDGPGTPVSSTGSGSAGATRVYTFSNSGLGAGNFTANEILNQVLPPGSGNSNLEQRWSIQAPETYFGGALVLSQAWSDLTVFQSKSGTVGLQYFMNVCASNQQLAYQALPVIISSSLNFWAKAASGNPCTA